ncbi:MAG TPA: peptidylprolyl isomerase, partial [Allocoleopsis sp.]
MKTQITPYRWLACVFLVGVLLLGGCTTNRDTTAATSSANGTSQAQATATPANGVSSEFSNLPRLQGEAIVELVVKGSPIKIVVNGMDAPITAGNFVDLVNRGVYNGLAFHRVIRD